MRKLVFVLSLTLFVGVSAQQAATLPPPGKANAGSFYGAKPTAEFVKNAVSVKELTRQVKKQEKVAEVAVKGKVTDVCDKKGCWLTLETDNNEKFFVKMKDYAFFVPLDLIGKNVVLQGSAERKVTSVEELKHYAEDAKKTQAEIDAITAPKEETRFLASGILVLK